jgi:FkbM family methyltransferase
MLIVSSMADMIRRHGGPRLRFQIDCWRANRYGHVEREWKMLADFVDQDRAAVDVGGHKGIYAGRLGQLARSVHCFEPQPSLAAELQTKLPRRVVVHGIALSDEPGQATLRVPIRAAGEEQGLATLRSISADSEGPHLTIEVPLARLDDVVTEPVGFIKIDVEGHEMSVLRGCQRIILDDQPNFLVESEARHAPGAPGELFSWMAGHGYRGLYLDGPKLTPVEEFNAARHQQLDAKGMPQAGYINNFFFVPAKRKQSQG